jgi:hypothetical protein
MAAARGDLIGMNTARLAGATNFNRGAMNAAQNNQILALQELHRWGITDLKCVACAAARAGHINIVLQCRKWGLTQCIGHGLGAHSEHRSWTGRAPP